MYRIKNSVSKCWVNSRERFGKSNSCLLSNAMNFFLKLVLLRGEQRQLHMIINSIYCLLFPWLWFYKNYLFHWWCAWCLSVILLLWRNTFSGLIQIEARLNKSQQISAAYCVKNKIQIWFTCTFYFYLMPSYPVNKLKRDAICF